MSAQQCCPVDTPQISTLTHEPQGFWSIIAGVKTYVSGSPHSKRGIMVVYDAFGPANQTLQGVDTLSTSLNAVVFVPDFLDGKYAQEEWIMGQTFEQQEKKTEFMQSLAYSYHGPVIAEILAEASKEYPSIEAWAGFGLCWGGKMIALASGKETRFRVSGQAHPGSPTKEDAQNIVIPHICLAAPHDNKAGGIDGYKEVFGRAGSQSVVEIYETMFHGWMGARAELEDRDNAQEFARGYKQIADFFVKYF